ncbi:MAG: hypothetical protein H6712_00575 [Myxococcales bacterium]|nr:hypothetical protein [Myxococcales bacterium]
MFRRHILRLSLLSTLVAVGCEKPPAGETEPPESGNAAASDDAGASDDADGQAEASLPAAAEILAKSIEAVGGKAAIDAIESSYMEAKTEIKAQNMSIATRIWSKGDNFYLESDMEGMGTSKVWKKGDEVWSEDPINGKRKLEGKEADQARWSADPMLAANWKDYFDEAKTIGRRTIGDQEVVEVELSKGDTKLMLLFDSETFLPAGQSFMQETPMGAMPIEVTYEDYREVAGVMTAFRSVTDMQLMSAVQTTEKYEVNVEIDDTKFEPN